jgi:hypothetical protein
MRSRGKEPGSQGGMTKVLCFGQVRKQRKPRKIKQPAPRRPVLGLFFGLTFFALLSNRLLK